MRETKRTLTLVSGGEQSGKTSFIKNLIKDYVARKIKKPEETDGNFSDRVLIIDFNNEYTEYPMAFQEMPFDMPRPPKKPEFFKYDTDYVRRVILSFEKIRENPNYLVGIMNRWKNEGDNAFGHGLLVIDRNLDSLPNEIHVAVNNMLLVLRQFQIDLLLVDESHVNWQPNIIHHSHSLFMFMETTDFISTMEKSVKRYPNPRPIITASSLLHAMTTTDDFLHHPSKFRFYCAIDMENKTGKLILNNKVKFQF